jgi:hypothetical protein
MKLFKLIASRAGQVLFDDRVEAESPREAREQMKALLGMNSLTGVVYAITEIPVDLIQSIVEAKLAEAVQRLQSGRVPVRLEDLIRSRACARPSRRRRPSQPARSVLMPSPAVRQARRRSQRHPDRLAKRPGGRRPMAGWSTGGR